MIIRSSLCGHVKLETKIADEPQPIIAIEIFCVRIRQHLKLNQKCRLVFIQDPVIKFIYKRIQNDIRSDRTREVRRYGIKTVN